VTAGSTRRQTALVAALLDADGAVVSYRSLGIVVGAAEVNVAPVVRQYVQRLRRHGVEIETVARRGCRLLRVPPDELLEDVLAVLDEMRRDGWGMPMLAWRRTA
jgi:biotin operon repressor